MKKILSLLMISAFAVIVACGPSAEEKAAAEKARQDSINSAMAKMTEDSLNAANAAMEQMRQDSMMMAMRADSIAMASKKPAPKAKPAPKTVQEKKAEEAKKVTGGRGH